MTEFNAIEYSEVTKAMKSADTTAENKATPWARLTLTALLSNALTIATMDSVLIATYKPKTAAGKAATSRGALPASPRGRANTMAYIFTNKDVGDVRSIVDAFVADAKGAPRSIAALHTAVKDAVKAFGESVAIPSEGEGEDEGEQDNAPTPSEERDNALTVALLADTLCGMIQQGNLSDDDNAALARLLDVMVAATVEQPQDVAQAA